MKRLPLTLVILAVIFASCFNPNKTDTKETPSFDTVGEIERLHPDLDEIISVEAKIEVIGSGLTWAEGPLWVASHNMLLCSDVKMDKICLLYTSPSPRDRQKSRMPSSA